MRLALRRANDCADSPPYLTLLKLHTPPFSKQTGNTFFYADAERTQYLDRLQHLTKSSEQLLLVLGDKGVGKSALLDKYLERVEENWRLCRLAGAQTMDRGTLSARVAECFAAELGSLEASQLPDALPQYLEPLLGLHRSVLVIDDAHALPDDALEMVLQLAAMGGGKLLRVLLFAESSIDGRLHSTGFASIAAPCRIELKPLQEWDSAVYLLHRLQHAGLSGSSPFSAADMKQLYRQARGIPARLNQAAHDLLLERSRRRYRFLGIPASSLRYGIATTALIVTVLFMHERINLALVGGSLSRSALPADHQGDRSVANQVGESAKVDCGGTTDKSGCPVLAAQPLEKRAEIRASQLEPLTELHEQVIETGKTEKPSAVTEAQPPAARRAVVKAVTDNTGEAVDRSVNPPRPVPGVSPPNPLAGSDKLQGVPLPSLGQKAGGMIEGSAWIAAQPVGNLTLQLLAASERHALDEFVADHAMLEGPLASYEQLQGSNRLHVLIQGSYNSRGQAEAAARRLPDNLQSWIRDFGGIRKVMAEPAEISAVMSAASAMGSGTIKDTAWVWSQQPNHHTIQLSGAADEASIEAVMHGLKLPGELAVVQTLRDGKSWYALIYGSFADRSGAEVAISRFSDRLKQAGPWVRRFSALQEEIGRAGTSH